MVLEFNRRATVVLRGAVDAPSTLLEGISWAELREGVVHALVSSNYAASGLALRSAGVTVALSAVAGSASPVDGAPFHVRLPFDPSPKATTNETGYVAHVDAFSDWSLDGVQTLQIEIRDDRRRHVAPVGPAVRIPPGPAPVELAARLASHRAEATLIVRVLGEDGAESVHEVDFDARHGGGRRTEGYQKALLRLPGAKGWRFVSAELLFRRRIGDDRTFPCVLFVAGVELTRGGLRLDAPTPRTWIGKPVADPVWLKGALPAEALDRGAPIELVAGDERLEIVPAETMKVSLLADEGWGLRLSANAAGLVLLYADGALALSVTLEAGEGLLRLPAQLLRGDTLRLQLRDGSASRTFLDTHARPPRILTPVEVLRRESPPPYVEALDPRAGRRHLALKAHLTGGVDPSRAADLAHALTTLEGGYDRVVLRPFALPEPTETPDVSVVIPAHNQVAVTYSCLCAMLVAWNRVSVEVVLVDDGSTDATADIETLVAGLRVVRHAAPQRFVRACNAGVAASRGQFVALLNNDTEPTTGWLDELVAAFGRFERVGLVGAKLLYPDGRLQDAGGIVWRSGNPWNYGRGENPWDPRFCYARQADYLSGAALLTSRAIWDRVGGLSAEFEPMYFEDTDLAFKVRAAGRSTWFVPSAIVYHYEGATSGTDVSVGYKRFQEVNRPKFKRRWAAAFAEFGQEATAPDLEKDRNIAARVLFVDYTTPRPDQDAGGYAAVEEMRLVRALGHKVTFLPENLAHMGRYTTDLEAMGVEAPVAPFYLSVAEFLEKRAAEFDAVYVTRYHVARNILPALRALNPRVRVILNTADLHFLRTLRAGRALGDAGLISKAAEIRADEIAALEAADLVLTYSDVEQAVIESHAADRVKVMRCPWVALPVASPSPRIGRAGLSFLGGFRHHPNREAAQWFTETIMAELALRLPGMTLTLYGSGVTPEIEALASDVVTVVGHVPDVATAYDDHLAFVAPLLSGAGVKGKVIGALAHGIPCLLSPVAAEGLGLRHGVDSLICRTPGDWIEATVRLTDDAALWEKLSGNGLALVREAYSFERGLADMRAAFETVELFGMR